MQEIAAYITANWTGGSSTPNIKYTYHVHSNSCYGTCGGQQVHIGNWTNQCTSCGTTSSGEASQAGRCTAYVIKCGKTTSTIESVTITY